MNEERKYAVELSGGDWYSHFGGTPEEALDNYLDDPPEDVPAVVDVVECIWDQPQNYTRDGGFAEVICDHLVDQIASDTPDDYGNDIIRGLQAEGTAKELSRLLEPVITAWFTNLCARQGGMNWFTTGQVFRLPTGTDGPEK